MGNMVGSGSSAQVRKFGSWAIKYYKREDGREIQMINYLIEIATLKHLKSDFVIEPIDFHINFWNCSLKMRYGDPVLDFVQIYPTLKFSILEQVIEAVSYIHSQGLIHLDIKPDNMIVVNQRLKLIDFELSLFMTNQIIPANTAYTFYYRPPELLTQDCQLHPSLDFWATGISLFEILTGSLPYDKTQVTNIKSLLSTLPHNYEAKYPDFSSLPKKIWPTIKGLLKINPSSRRLKGHYLIPLSIDRHLVWTECKIPTQKIYALLKKTLNQNFPFWVVFMACKLLYQLPPAYASNCIDYAYILSTHDRLTHISSLDSKQIKSLLKEFGDSLFDFNLLKPFYFYQSQVPISETKQKTFEFYYTLVLFNQNFFHYSAQLIFDTVLNLINHNPLTSPQYPIQELLFRTYQYIYPNYDLSSFFPNITLFSS